MIILAEIGTMGNSARMNQSHDGVFLYLHKRQCIWSIFFMVLLHTLILFAGYLLCIFKS